MNLLVVRRDVVEVIVLLEDDPMDDACVVGTTSKPEDHLVPGLAVERVRGVGCLVDAGTIVEHATGADLSRLNRDRDVTNRRRRSRSEVAPVECVTDGRNQFVDGGDAVAVVVDGLTLRFDVLAESMAHRLQQFVDGHDVVTIAVADALSNRVLIIALLDGRPEDRRASVGKAQQCYQPNPLHVVSSFLCRKGGWFLASLAASWIN